jgi:hypothetical protein
MIGGLLIAGVMAPISLLLIMPDIFITLYEHMEICKLKYRFGTCKWFVLSTLKSTVNIISSDYLISELSENVRILVMHSYLNDIDSCRICIRNTSIVMEEYLTIIQ